MQTQKHIQLKSPVEGFKWLKPYIDQELGRLDRISTQIKDLETWLQKSGLTKTVEARIHVKVIETSASSILGKDGSEEPVYHYTLESSFLQWDGKRLNFFTQLETCDLCKYEEMEVTESWENLQTHFCFELGYCTYSCEPLADKTDPKPLIECPQETRMLVDRVGGYSYLADKIAINLNIDPITGEEL